MNTYNCYTRKMVLLFTSVIMLVLVTSNVFAQESKELAVAFPDKWMLRAGTNVVQDADTQVSINSSLGGIGSAIAFQKDLGW